MESVYKVVAQGAAVSSLFRWQKLKNIRRKLHRGVLELSGYF